MTDCVYIYTVKKLLLFCSFLLSACCSFGNTDSLLQAAARLKQTDTTLVSVYSQTAWSYLATNDTTNTLLYLRKSRALAEELKFDRGIIASYSNIALYYTRFGAIDSSIAYFSLGLKKAKETNNTTVASKICGNLAGAYLSKGNYAEAIQYYLEALQHLEKANDQPKIATNYHCLGIAYYMLKNYPLSLKYYDLSLATGIKIGTPDKSGYNYNGIGVVYKEMKRYDSATHYLDMAHTDAERNKDLYLLSHNLSDKGEVLSLQGQIPQALECLTKAANIQAQENDEHGLAETLVLLGDAYLSNKDYGHSKKYFDSARILATAIGSRDVLKNSWKGLSTVYNELKNYPASLDAYKHYSDLKDTIYTQESTRQIAEMQTKYNTEKKEKQNIQLQNENTIKDLQLTKERNLTYILVVCFISVIIISVVYYNRYRLKQKNEILKERELRAYAVLQAQENEKGKLSKELHDGVGALLSLIKLNISSINVDESNQKILMSTKNLATSAIKEVRGISHDLMPSVLVKSGLQAALEEMAESVNSAGGLSFELDYALTERMPMEIEGNIFRIVQEATNNIIKHAGATKETVSITNKNIDLSLTISDNGSGFDKNILSKISGNGLNNIYSRVNIMKGETNIITGKGNGTQINISVPLKNRAHA
ncbi:MAG: Signal transduction histidine-protein kinase/phosphatase DegS [Flavipsychrobacter sp.]|nr:Signal transduction histidine-protein kinase/phosphatase DegS [Flavipsychrobacter sp.]